MLSAGLDGSLEMADISWQISRNLDLAPSTMALAALEQELSTAHDKDRRLMQVLSTVDDKYDFCVIDCPPSIGLLTFNAMRAAQEVIIPVETGYFALQGSIKQKATIEMLSRRAGHNARFEVLATMYDVRTKLAREILAELKKNFGDKLMPVVVHFNSKLKEAASFGQAITEYDPTSRGHEDFARLVDWLVKNPPESKEPQFATADAGADNPALSRAAELVERARVLTQRSSAMTAQLSTDPDFLTESTIAEPTMPAPPTPAVVDTQNATEMDLVRKLERIYGVRSTNQGLLFVQPANGTNRMSVAGEFNDWSDTATPMKMDDSLGIWQACIDVPPGRYRYRLIADGNWIQDPYNNYVEANPFGELDNVVDI